MNAVTVTLPDGTQREVPRGTSVREFAASALPQSIVRKALAAVVDGRLVDLSYPISSSGSLELVLPEGPEALTLYRHSTAHLLAAIQYLVGDLPVDETPSAKARRTN